MAEDHEKHRVEDRAQDWRVATKDYLCSCVFSVKLMSGDILNFFSLQTEKEMGFSRGNMGCRCQILSAFALQAVLTPHEAPASADISPSRYQIWGVSRIPSISSLPAPLATCLFQRKP